MELLHLELENFRNLSRVSRSFPSGLNLVTGPNAQGKSNLLEALFLLSVGKSLRAHREDDLIQWGAPFARIVGRTALRDGEQTVEAVLERGGAFGIRKTLRINGTHCSRLSQFVGRTPMVHFLPSDLDLVQGEPFRRRRYLDVLGAQLHPDYLRELQSYQKALRERNHLLRTDPRESLLQSYEILLAESGSRITLRRAALVERLAPLAARFHREFTQEVENLRIEYRPSIELEEREANLLVEAFLREFARSRGQEIVRKTTLTGPHRDDLAVFVNGKDARFFGSQGQQRTASISLKLAEAGLMEEEQGDPPLLLLDDILSELDRARTRSLLAHLPGSRQILITITEEEKIRAMFTGPLSTHVIRQGEILAC
ncbi:MAG: DNA replication/repair protein RecF [Armatimonadetes bacterium]|nr:DNA replication/repair protein RecF [Armatimonadota bacterium]